MDPQTFLTGLSTLATIILSLVVYSFKTTIRVSILEAMSSVADKFATKGELASAENRLKEQIGLRKEVHAGFQRLGVLLRDDGDES